MTAQTLVLNASFEPLMIVEWERAIVLWAQGKVEIVETYDRVIRSAKLAMRLPSVVRFLHYVQQHRGMRVVPFTRANLYARDRYACQFCGDVLPFERLTFDHVIPVAQGGQRSWENLVSACEPCNRRKADRTPEQAGMHLLRKPKRPVATPASRLSARKVHVGWRDYLELDPKRATVGDEDSLT
jgi:5-methylcytosine-specific restriction endonuclease McrA